MNPLETYDKNRKKHLLTEENKENRHLLKEVTAVSAVGTRAGGAGDHIDRTFSGAFHPDFGKLRKLLRKQIDDDIVRRLYTDGETPTFEQDFIDLEWEYPYDEEVKKDTSKFKNTSETDMQLVDMEYEYTPTGRTDKTKFKNTSETDMQLVDMNIRYDKIIDKTEENMKYVNDTNDWKSIYDSKK